MTHRRDRNSITTPGQNGPGSTGNEGVLHTPYSARIATSPLDTISIVIRIPPFWVKESYHSSRGYRQPADWHLFYALLTDIYFMPSGKNVVTFRTHWIRTFPDCFKQGSGLSDLLWWLNSLFRLLLKNVFNQILGKHILNDGADDLFCEDILRNWVFQDCSSKILKKV